jgi:small-conductance mechanosensitive channel
VSETWRRLIVALAVVCASLLVARIVDRRIARRELPPEAITRYRVLRRSIVAAIVFVGFLSALLEIPEVRAMAGGILASSAAIGIVVGFASQRTIGNFVAGILIALSQPLRLGDEVTVEGTAGIVEEIGMTYTWLRTPTGARLVVPNEKLASETIRNATIRRSDSVAEAAVRIPFSADLRGAVEALKGVGDEVLVTRLAEDATVVVRRRLQGVDLELAASELRLEIADRLKAEGVALA